MTRLQWRCVFSIVFWLFLFPPWGLYLLWKEPTLDRATKWRVAIYSLFVLVAVPFALMLYTFHVGEKMIQAAGGGY